MKLAEKADILVENYVPGTMEKFGLGYKEVSARNPRIIYVAGSGFGLEGPYARKPAFDVIIQAMGGVMSHTGEPGGNPVRPGASYGDIAAGLFLCISALAALQERHVSGKGQMIDISMLDCQVAVQENAFARYLNTGEIARPLGTRHPVMTPFQTFPTRDGHIAVALRGGIKNQWPLYCAAINRIDLIDDPRFETGWFRTQNYEVLEPMLTAAMKTRTTAEWVIDLEAAGIPCGPLNNIAQAVQDPGLQSRNMFLEIEHNNGVKLKVVNSPFKFSRTPIEVVQPAPDLGENNSEILGSLLGLSKEEIARLITGT
jgi:CoA:oxalate CoA-transferase